MPVVPAVAPGPFATVADLATYLQRDLSAAETATATLLLDLASAEIRSYTGQTLTLTSDTVTFTHLTGFRIFLPELPVTAISAFTIEGTAQVLDTDYYWFSDTGVVQLIRRSYYTAPVSASITYSHGYATVPDVVRAVTLEAAAAAFGSAGSGDVQSEDIGGYSVTYRDEVARTVSEIAPGRLDRFRLLVVA